MHAATDDVRFDMLISDDNGSSYKTDSDHQRNSFGLASDNASILKNNNDSGTQFELTPQNIGNAAGENTSGEVTFFNPQGTDNFKQWIGQNQFTKTNQVAIMYVLGGVYKKTATQINNIKFQMTSGNIASGVFKIYGIT